MKYSAKLLTCGPAIAVGVTLGMTAMTASASSHREAPFITGSPKVDGTDFYMFRSYEEGRDSYVTLIANYVPLQDAYGGPNYFSLDQNALYEIHIDNNGDSTEDLTFQFRFSNDYQGITDSDVAALLGLELAGDGAGNNPIPLVNLPPDASGNPALNLVETYTVSVVEGNRRSGNSSSVSNAADNSTTFAKPLDYIGRKSIPDYPAYASQFIYDVNIPGCDAAPSRLFVGQRREGFVVNLGQVFDLVNLNPLAARTSPSDPANAEANIIGDKNITSLALEIPIACLTAGEDPVIGAWTTASVRQARLQNPNPVGPNADASGFGPTREGGAWTQVSRLGSPLVNEVVIGITDKDKFNASHPTDDVANFGSYVLNPTLPVLVQALFGVPAPATPRNDLLAAFVTGITTGPNDNPANFNFTAPSNLTTPGEMLRMNTAIAPVAPGAAGYSDLGFLGCDLAGFPNGRRVTDDVVDIALTVAEGALTGENGLQTCDLTTGSVANEGAVVNDGTVPNPADYQTVFPYLATPVTGGR